MRTEDSCAFLLIKNKFIEVNEVKTMELKEALLKRRSVRKFTDEPVSDEMIEELLHAAMSGPSACNKKPWKFDTCIATSAGKLLDSGLQCSDRKHSASCNRSGAWSSVVRYSSTKKSRGACTGNAGHSKDSGAT